MAKRLKKGKSKAFSGVVDKKKLFTILGIALGVAVIITAVVLLCLQFLTDVKVFGDGDNNKLFSGVRFSTYVYEKDYDGEPISVELIGLPDKTKVEISYVHNVGSVKTEGKGNSFVLAGDYDVKAVLNKKGYRPKELTCQVKIYDYYTITFVQEGFFDIEQQVRYGDCLTEDMYPDFCLYPADPSDPKYAKTYTEGVEYSWEIVQGLDFITQNHEVTAVTEFIEYDIQYLDSNNQPIQTTNITNYTVKQLPIRLTALENTDTKQFIGWCTDPQLTKGSIVKSISSCANRVLYAIYNQGQEGTPTLLYTEQGDEYTVSGYDVELAERLDKNEDGILEQYGGYFDRTKVIVPDSYNGKPVTKIGANAFLNDIKITNLTLANTITEIGENAFSGCENLSTVNFSDDIRIICKYAFERCAISSLVLPDSLIEVQEGAFSRCGSLNDLQFNDSIESLGDKAFYGASYVTELVLPDSITQIGESCFANCINLKKITLGIGINTIPTKSFGYDLSLRIINITSADFNLIEQQAFLSASLLEQLNFAGSEQNWADVTIQENNSELDDIVYNFNVDFLNNLVGN